MLGAILGDIIGSPFEFDRGDKTKNFKLFSDGCRFTDDSVMTVAVADALISVSKDASSSDIKKAVTEKMRFWGRKYINAGYGGRFALWLTSENPKPYQSFGNGSAMRVSAAGWLYDSIERTTEVSRYTAEVTHNHPDGIKGAESTAACIYLARTGKTKEEIKNFVEKNFDCDLNRTLDEIRPGYHMMPICQKSVPEAITSFLESENFEDAIRNAVSLGGDTDTVAAISGSIAEAFYGIPENLKKECRSRLPEDMNDVIDRFESVLKRYNEK